MKVMLTAKAANTPHWRQVAQENPCTSSTYSRNRHAPETHLLLRLILRGLRIRMPLRQLSLRLQKALHKACCCLVVLCLHSSILATRRDNILAPGSRCCFLQDRTRQEQGQPRGVQPYLGWSLP